MYLLPSLLKEALHHFTIRTKLGVSKSHINYCNRILHCHCLHFQVCQHVPGHLDYLRHLHHVRGLLLRGAGLHDQKIRGWLCLHPCHPGTSGGFYQAMDWMYHCQALYRGHPVLDLRSVHHQAPVSWLHSSRICLKIVGCK